MGTFPSVLATIMVLPELDGPNAWRKSMRIVRMSPSSVHSTFFMEQSSFRNVDDLIIRHGARDGGFGYKKERDHDLVARPARRSGAQSIPVVQRDPATDVMGVVGMLGIVGPDGARAPGPETGRIWHV